MRIGLTGYAKSGKDEVADVLVAEYGFVKLNMSDALNHYLCILNPKINPELRYADAIKAFGYVGAKERFPEVRRLLQMMGTDVGREIDPDLWVKELSKTAQYHERVVTTGIRYDNEYTPDMLLVAVVRPGVGPLNDHSSENLQHLIDRAEYIIQNDGTLDQLRDRTRFLADLLSLEARS